MSEPTGYGPDYYKSESELRAELAAKGARIAELEQRCGDETIRSMRELNLRKELADIKNDRSDFWDHAALRKELAEAKAALTRTQDASLWWDQYNLEVRKHADTKTALEAANASLADQKQFRQIDIENHNELREKWAEVTVALEAADARIASLMTGADRYWEERWRNAERLCDQRGTALEAANARIAELEEDLRGREAVADSYATENQQLHDRAKRAEAEADSLRATIDNMRAMNIKLTFEEMGKVLAAEAENARLREMIRKICSADSMYEVWEITACVPDPSPPKP